LREIIEVRLLIEPRAAGLAADRATPEIIERMQECLEKFQLFSDANDLAGMVLADTEFHKTVAKATCNKTLTFLMNTMTRYLPEGWKASLKVPQRPQKTITEHRTIYQAIKDHDSKQSLMVSPVSLS
jgi:GntR family transcriptional repressor for pyruvate dehydrogenase complex